MIEHSPYFLSHDDDSAEVTMTRVLHFDADRFRSSCMFPSRTTYWLEPSTPEAENGSR